MLRPLCKCLLSLADNTVECVHVDQALGEEIIILNIIYAFYVVNTQCLDAAYTYECLTVPWSMCLSVCWPQLKLCNNLCTDRDSVWSRFAWAKEHVTGVMGARTGATLRIRWTDLCDGGDTA